jgi:hypothetical protein
MLNSTLAGEHAIHKGNKYSFFIAAFARLTPIQIISRTCPGGVS